MENSKYLRSVAKGTVGTLLFSFIGITVLSLLMTKIVFSKGIFNMLYVIISLCSLSLGAIMGAKKNESKGWLVGFGVAIGYYFILFILSSIFSGEIAFKLFDFVKLLIALAVGTLAGMLGINL
ncbi:MULTISPECIES: TIGR04086 family membrane protein [unclassified Clostridium]|uniref:TIGR04086 family membrane protein n=1 Tax=unclassified Clostridium TaxID=2614128 RepID=UPI0002986E68|nr:MULTISPECIES: TIGR04086 family membrane protein [unclassified Clostridium]EKQ56990.1 MAG: putative membrane protein, TIGR04086 family [Clostridium sp. Maddingley MBC34-26]